MGSHASFGAKTMTTKEKADKPVETDIDQKKVTKQKAADDKFVEEN